MTTEIQDKDIDVSIENARDRTTAIRNIVRSMELRYSGYIWSEDGNKFIYKGSPLCGKTVIAKAVGLLQPFCEEANLITDKEKKVFSRQKYEISSTFNNTLLNEMGCTADNYKVIMKIFKACIQNIGDIILSSREVIRPMFNSYPDEREREEDIPRRSRRDYEDIQENY